MTGSKEQQGGSNPRPGGPDQERKPGQQQPSKPGGQPSGQPGQPGQREREGDKGGGGGKPDRGNPSTPHRGEPQRGEKDTETPRPPLPRTDTDPDERMPSYTDVPQREVSGSGGAEGDE